MNENLTWQVREAGTNKKSNGWYWTIGILAVGGSVATFISGNFLFGIILLIGGFAIALAGSRSDTDRTYHVDEKGFSIDGRLITWDRIVQFCIYENAPQTLVIETETLVGTTTVPLTGIDFRVVRTIFKNHNVEEADELESFSENITRAIGL